PVSAAPHIRPRSPPIFPQPPASFPAGSTPLKNVSASPYSARNHHQIIAITTISIFYRLHAIACKFETAKSRVSKACSPVATQKPLPFSQALSADHRHELAFSPLPFPVRPPHRACC